MTDKSYVSKPSDGIENARYANRNTGQLIEFNRQS